MNPHIRTASIASAGADGIVLDAVLRHQADARADAVAIALSSYGPNEQPVIGGRTDVVKDSQRPVEFSEDHVHAAIVVQVPKASAAVHASPGTCRTHPRPDVSNLPMSPILQA